MSRPRPDPRSARGPRPQLLVALCAAGAALFNFPLLVVWDGPATVLGLPLLPVALFGIWGLLVLALAVVSERPRASGRSALRHPGDALPGAHPGEDGDGPGR